MPATLTSQGAQVATVTNDLSFDPSFFSVGACTINPAIGSGTAPNKQLAATFIGPGLERVATGSNTNVIPDGLLYTCTVPIAGSAALGSHVLLNTPGASDPAGNPIRVVTGAQGTIVVTNCTGDCNGDGTVSIGEVIKCVNLFLGEPFCNVANPNISCPVADANLNGIVSIGEVTQCVTRFLNGCN